jgi:hypothetical protein
VNSLIVMELCTGVVPHLLCWSPAHCGLTLGIIALQGQHSAQETKAAPLQAPSKPVAPPKAVQGRPTVGPKARTLQPAFKAPEGHGERRADTPPAASKAMEASHPSDLGRAAADQQQAQGEHGEVALLMYGETVHMCACGEAEKLELLHVLATALLVRCIALVCLLHGFRYGR